MINAKAGQVLRWISKTLGGKTHILLVGILLCSCTSDATPLSFELLEQHPHDTKIFTQGMEVYDGDLIESSGLYRRSFLRLYEPDTQIIHKHLD